MKLADTRDLKSLGPKSRAGSIPVAATIMRNNGHTHCCDGEPTLRVSPRPGLVYFQCNSCNRKGCDGVDDQDAGMNWEMMLMRVKYQIQNEYQEVAEKACKS